MNGLSIHDVYIVCFCFVFLDKAEQTLNTLAGTFQAPILILCRVRTARSGEAWHKDNCHVEWVSILCTFVGMQLLGIARGVSDVGL